MQRFLRFLLFAFLISCHTANDDEGEILARVGDDYLYSSELKGVILHNAPAKDSLILAKNYMNNWVREKLMLRQALLNLSEEQTNFDKQLEDYRNSLIIYQYKKLLVDQKLDTLITWDDIQMYYEENIEAFRLKENIVRVNYLKLIEDSVNVYTYRRLLHSDEPDQLTLLDSLCHVSAIEYSLNSKSWMPFNKLMAQIPINTLDQENYLRNHRNAELSKDTFIYLVRFHEYKLAGEIAPLEYVKTSVKKILLNKRKIDLLGNMEDEIFNEALNNNVVEIY